jgi:hypothetical protein
MSARREIDSKWMYAITPKIRAEVAQRAVDGTLTCAVARKIADELDVPNEVVGAAANLAEIRIKNCSLGCF